MRSRARAPCHTASIQGSRERMICQACPSVHRIKGPIDMYDTAAESACMPASPLLLPRSKRMSTLDCTGRSLLSRQLRRTVRPPWRLCSKPARDASTRSLWRSRLQSLWSCASSLAAGQPLVVDATTCRPTAGHRRQLGCGLLPCDWRVSRSAAVDHSSSSPSGGRSLFHSCCCTSLPASPVLDLLLNHLTFQSPGHDALACLSVCQSVCLSPRHFASPFQLQSCS